MSVLGRNSPFRDNEKELKFYRGDAEGGYEPEIVVWDQKTNRDFDSDDEVDFNQLQVVVGRDPGIGFVLHHTPVQSEKSFPHDHGGDEGVLLHQATLESLGRTETCFDRSHRVVYGAHMHVDGQHQLHVPRSHRQCERMASAAVVLSLFVVATLMCLFSLSSLDIAHKDEHQTEVNIKRELLLHGGAGNTDQSGGVALELLRRSSSAALQRSFRKMHHGVP